MLGEKLLDRRIRPGGLALPTELEPAPGHLDIDVGLGPAGQLLEDLVLADRLRDRVVHVVVPAGRRLRQRHLAVLLQGHEVSVAEDVIEDLVVATQAAALEPRLGPSAVQLRGLEEGGVLRGAQKGRGVGPRRQRRARPDVDDARVDRRPTKIPRHGNTVVAIDHVVAVVHLVNVDGRQLVAFDHRLVDACPALTHAQVDGQKTGVEVTGLRVRRDRADDLVERNLAHATRRAALDPGCLEHRLYGAQSRHPAGQNRAQAAPEGARTRGIEVLNRPYALHAHGGLARDPDYYRSACSDSASKKCMPRVSRPSLTLSPGETFMRGSTRAVSWSPPTVPYRNWSDPSRSTTSTFMSMVGLPSAMRSVTASGRNPSVPFCAATAFGSLTSKPEAFADPLVMEAGTKFMVGVPMKPATKRFAGWS